MSCAPASSLGALPDKSLEPRGRHTGIDHRATGEGAPAMSRRAKIVCTLGPATSGPGMATQLVAAGLDVARLNMSHGDHDAHRAAYQDVPGDQNEVSVSYPALAGDVRPGTRLLVDDGRVVLEVTAVQGERVRTRVLVGGPVSDHKGLNLPGVRVSVPALTSKDADDLRWALALRADMIALSFVQGPDDAEPPRKIMDEVGVRLPLIAKVEKPQAVAALDEVVAAFDGIMVARGDLGVEYPLEQVPLVQKRAIKLARQAAKPVIVATQMLESMISAPRRPWRGSSRRRSMTGRSPCPRARRRPQGPPSPGPRPRSGRRSGPGRWWPSP